MNSLSKKAGVHPPLKDKLKDKLTSLKQIEDEQIQYVQGHYLLNNKRIKQNVIKAFLKQKYGERFQNVNVKWKSQMSNQQIIDDVFFIKRKVIEEQWVTQSIDQNRVKEKDIRFKDYLAKVKEKKDVKRRIKQLKDELQIIQNEMNFIKKDEEIIPLRKKYDNLKAQYAFWMDRKRFMTQLNNQKNLLDNEFQDNKKVLQLQKLMEQRSLEKERKRYVAALTSNINESINLNTIPKNHRSGEQKIKKLEQLFYRFAKKERKDKKLFAEFGETEKQISLENFLRMAGQTNIDSLLTLQQRVFIFKQCSKYRKTIDFTNFVNALRQICIKNCEKLKVDFTAQSLDMFLDDFISKLASNPRATRLISPMNKQRYTLDVKTNKLSNYQFKLIGHSGKMANQLKEELLLRKESRRHKLHKIKQKSTRISSPIEYSRLQTVQSINPMLYKQQYFRKNKNQRALTCEIENDKHSLYARLGTPKKTYATIFHERRSTEGKRHRISTENQVDSREPYSGKKIKDFNQDKEFSIEYDSIQSKKQSEQSSLYNFKNHELKDLLDEDDDPFLTSHLQKKAFMINEEYSARKQRKIHF